MSSSEQLVDEPTVSVRSASAAGKEKALLPIGTENDFCAMEESTPTSFLEQSSAA